MKVIETDHLVIGSGLAGLSYAASLEDSGQECIVLCSGEDYTTSNSYNAQGGIVYTPPSQFNSLEKDLKEASAGVANIKAIKQIGQYGAQALEEILFNKARVPFDVDVRGKLKLTKEAAHSVERIIHCKDATGVGVMNALQSSLKDSRHLKIFNNTMAIDLITFSHSSLDYNDRFGPLTCIGAYALNLKNGEVFAFLGKQTIIATGGIGQIFLHTTNGKDALGHGLAMASRVGARLMDLEYIQFHPTVFCCPSFPPLLISETLRGEGGVLINAQGDEFMNKIHSKGSLAARDIITRAITFELLKSGEKTVYLDLSMMRSDFIQLRFPTIFEKCLERGIDITSKPIPVVPAAHYLCGGIHTNLKGQTNIGRLSAIGEVACTGLHGANRLASISLLECVVMGKVAAKKNIESLKEFGRKVQVKPWAYCSKPVDKDLIQKDLDLIRNVMWNYVGLIRSKEKLERAMRLLNELFLEIKDFYADGVLSKELLDLRSAIYVAKIITHASLQNKQSIGCHFREN